MERRERETRSKAKLEFRCWSFGVGEATLRPAERAPQKKINNLENSSIRANKRGTIIGSYRGARCVA